MSKSSEFNISDIATNIGDQIMEEVKQQLKEDWTALAPTAKDDLRKAALRYGFLVAKGMSGQDVDEPMQVLRATMKNYVVAGKVEISQLAQNAFWKGAQRVAQTFGSFLNGLAGFGKGA